MILSAQDAGTNREGMSEDVADLDTKRTQAEGDTSAVTALSFFCKIVTFMKILLN